LQFKFYYLVLNAHLKSSQILDHDPKQLGRKHNREKL
jgi:hypothetical protein